jgi:hypothetical protein
MIRKLLIIPLALLLVVPLLLLYGVGALVALFEALSKFARDLMTGEL